jgi:hypothetical protein
MISLQMVGLSVQMVFYLKILTIVNFLFPYNIAACGVVISSTTTLDKVKSFYHYLNLFYHD